MRIQLIKASKSLLTLLLTFLVSIATFAQNKGLDINVKIGAESSPWYQETWVWAAGAAIFVLILVAILKNNSKK